MPTIAYAVNLGSHVRKARAFLSLFDVVAKESVEGQKALSSDLDVMDARSALPEALIFETANLLRSASKTCLTTENTSASSSSHSAK